MAKHILTTFRQTDLDMHEYISKFSDLVEHAYTLTPTDPVLYNVLPINRYIGNITIKWYNESVSDNRDPTVVLHQEIYTLPVSVASDTRCF